MQWLVPGHNKSFPERLRGQLSDSGWERCPAAGMAASPQDRAETRSVDLGSPAPAPRSVCVSDVRPRWPGAGFGYRPGRFGLRPRCSRDATVTGVGRTGVNGHAFHGHGQGARRNAGLWPARADWRRRVIFATTPCERISTWLSPAPWYSPRSAMT
jgi:hypothetical protein